MPNMQLNTAYWQEKKQYFRPQYRNIHSQKLRKKLCTIYFQALLSFKMFADPSFQVKQHLPSTDLLRWFQGDLKSIKWGSTW